MCNENKKEKTFEELEIMMKSSTGDAVRYQFHPLMRDLLMTHGVRYFVREAGAYWLCDIVFSYVPKLMKEDDYFFIVSLFVDKDNGIEGIFKIFREIDNELKTLIKQEIPYVDLPTGKYEFYLIREEKNFILLCKSEY